jgi:hypothetical protein
VKEIGRALESIETKSTAERIALMNTVCARIIERDDPAITSKEEFIFAMHGFEWNKPSGSPERVIAQKYDTMLTKHPLHTKGTPAARLLPKNDLKKYPVGNFDPILIGRIDEPICTIELRNDENGLPYYLGKFCLRLFDVITSANNADKNLSKQLDEDVEPLGSADTTIKIAELPVCLSRAKREVASAGTNIVEEISEVAYGWNEILEFSDLNGQKGIRLLGHISLAMQNWQD